MLGIVLASLVVFWPALNAEFLFWDDNHNVYENAQITSLDTDSLKWMFGGVGPDIRYKPLTYLTWASVQAVFGLKAFPYHVTNLLLHALNGLLLFLVLRQIGRRISTDPDENAQSTIDILAGLAVFVWLLHPLRVEPVAWVSCTAHHLSFCFALIAAWSYLTVGHSKSVFRQRGYWGAILAYCLSLLSFPLPLGFFAVFFALNLFPLKRLHASRLPSRQLLFELLPFLFISVLMTGVAAYSRMVVQGAFGTPVTLDQLPVIDRVMRGFYVWAYYLWRPFWPFDLGPVYMELADFTPFEPRMLLCALLVGGLSFYTFVERKTKPGLLAIWTAYLTLMVPLLGLTEGSHYPGDRYSLISGALMSAGAFIWLLLNNKRVPDAAIRFGGFGLIALFAGLSFNQAKIWQNDEVFFRYQIGYLPPGSQKSMALTRYGHALNRQERFEEAVAAYDEAIHSMPPYMGSDLPFSYGTALERLGRYEEAIHNYQLAIGNAPDLVTAWRRLGSLLFQLGQPGPAEKVFQDAIALHADQLELRIAHAEGLISMNQLDRADAVLGAAYAIPARVPAHAQRYEELVRQLAAVRQNRQ